MGDRALPVFLDFGVRLKSRVKRLDRPHHHPSNPQVRPEYYCAHQSSRPSQSTDSGVNKRAERGMSQTTRRADCIEGRGRLLAI